MKKDEYPEEPDCYCFPPHNYICDNCYKAEQPKSNRLEMDEEVRKLKVAIMLKMLR